MNATVTLPIGDLDKLREDLKESQDKVKFFEKNEKGYRLVRIDLADLSYTKQQIRNDIFKFISDSIFNYKKE